MKRLLVLFGAFLLFASPLFGRYENNTKAADLFEPDQSEKLSTLTCPPSSPVVLPTSVQYLAEQSPSDQFKKTKAFLGASFSFFYPKSFYPTVLNQWVNLPTLSNPLFILFRNLRL